MEDLCPPAWKIRGRPAEDPVPHNYPRVSVQNNHGIPRKKLSFLCHVPYVHTKEENSVRDTVAEVRARIVTKISSKFCHAFTTTPS